MSIVSMTKATIYGHVNDKAAAMDGLQDLGCLHLIALQRLPAGKTVVTENTGPTPSARKAWKFLCSTQPRHRQVHDKSRFDATVVEQRVLEIMDRLQTVRDEHDFIVKRIEELKPWGDFQLPPREQIPELNLWFYIVPHYLLHRVERRQKIWHVAHKDNRNSYVVVISKREPRHMPVERSHTGKVPYSQLLRRLEELESEREDLQVERFSLSRWCDLFAQSLNRLEDLALFHDAQNLTYNTEKVFVVQGWVPLPEVHRLKKYVNHHGLALTLEPPKSQDNPPTLMKNPPSVVSGQKLVSFYMTPGYRLWDPSRVVLFSFAVFFAIIMSDAGYALILGGLLGLFWGRLSQSHSGREMRQLWLVLFVASLAWGVLTGSYFGLQPKAIHWLAYLQVFNVQDTQFMLRFSIILGALHLGIANVIQVWRMAGKKAAFAPLGWIFVLLGGVLLWLASEGVVAEPALEPVSAWLLGGGLLLILLFTGTADRLTGRAWQGLIAMTRVTNVFGDVLSYIRLFALGLASASLAMAFNDLAGQVRHATPAFGTLLAFLVLLLGHGLNFALIIMSGFVHGLRLNFIEFFNWSVAEEGYAYRPFCRKESKTWSS